MTRASASARGSLRSPRAVVRAVAPLALGIALVAGIVAWIAPPWDEVADHVALRPGWLAVSVLGTALTTAFTAARWKLLSETMDGTRLPYGVYVHSLAAVRLLGQVLPAALVDLVGRGAALRAAGSRSRMGALITPLVLERLLDLLLPLAMLGWALAVVVTPRPELGPGIDPRVDPRIDPWVALAVLSALLVGLAIPLLGPMVTAALRIYHALRRLRPRERSSPCPPTPPVPLPLAARVVALGGLRYASMLLQFWAAGAGLGAALPPLVLVAATPVAQLAVLIGLTPGGLGLAEGGWTAALSRLGQDEVTIVVFMAATRLMMAVSFGLLTLVTWPWRSPRDATAP